MIRYFIGVFLFYWLFRFIFNFLVPVFRATRQMKQQVRDFQSGVNGQGNYQGAKSNYNTDPGPKPQQREEKPRSGDYIDFEDVK
jgi:hypothetical protein